MIDTDSYEHLSILCGIAFCVLKNKVKWSSNIAGYLLRTRDIRIHVCVSVSHERRAMHLQTDESISATSFVGSWWDGTSSTGPCVYRSAFVFVMHWSLVVPVVQDSGSWCAALRSSAERCSVVKSLQSWGDRLLPTTLLPRSGSRTAHSLSSNLHAFQPK